MVSLKSIFLGSILILLTQCSNETLSLPSPNDPKSVELYNLTEKAISELRKIEQDIARGFLLSSLSDNNRQLFASNIYEIKIALMRLQQDTKDIKAGRNLDIYISKLRSLSFSNLDRTAIEILVEKSIAVLDALDIVIVKDLYTNDFQSDLKGMKGYLVDNQGSNWVLTTEFGGQIRITGYDFIDKTTYKTENWLFTPGFNLSDVSQPHLLISQSVGYFNDWSNMTVLVSTNYRGGNPLDSEWRELTINQKPDGVKNWVMVTSEQISLEEFAGQSIVIAFRYLSPISQSSTWQLEEIWLRGAGSIQTFELDVPENAAIKTIVEEQLEEELKKAEIEEKKGSNDTSDKPSNPAGSENGNDNQASASEGINNGPYSLKNLPTVSAPWHWDFSEKLGPMFTAATTGSVTFLAANFTGNDGIPVYSANVSAFKKGKTTSWLITPMIDIKGLERPMIQINQAYNYFTNWSDMEVLVAATNSHFESITSVEWSPISFLTKPEKPNTYVWSEPFDLTPWQGQRVIIALRYHASDSQAATWRISDIKIGNQP